MDFKCLHEMNPTNKRIIYIDTRTLHSKTEFSSAGFKYKGNQGYKRAKPFFSISVGNVLSNFMSCIRIHKITMSRLR